MTTIKDLLNDLYMEAYYEGFANGTEPQRAQNEGIKEEKIDETITTIKERIVG